MAVIKDRKQNIQIFHEKYTPGMDNLTDWARWRQDWPVTDLKIFDMSVDRDYGMRFGRSRRQCILNLKILQS